jgi:hypothetical protein
VVTIVRRFKQGLLPLSGGLEKISRCPVRYPDAGQEQHTWKAGLGKAVRS